MIRWSYALLSSFSLLACNGCHDAAPPSSTPVGASASAPDQAATAAGATTATTVHADDDGKSFDVSRGAVLTFSLPSNAGTGYVWVPTQVDGSVLTQQGDRTSDVSSDVPGASKVDVYHFAAAAPGTTTVEMSLRRPFGSAPPARIIHVTVNVR
jgi:predicted secreted protein